MEKKELRVGIADLLVSVAPDILITVGLGSCVGIALYDNIKRIGGLAHIMLPDSSLFREIKNPYKFADLSVPILIEKMTALGAVKRNISAKIVGGASMFKFPDNTIVMDVGLKNINAVRNTLRTHSIPLIAEEVGGSSGRTMFFNISDGSILIRTVGRENKTI